MLFSVVEIYVKMYNIPAKLLAGELTMAAAAAPRLKYKLPVSKFLLASSSSSLLAAVIIDEGYRPLGSPKFGLKKCLGIKPCGEFDEEFAKSGLLSLPARRKRFEKGSPGYRNDLVTEMVSEKPPGG